MGSVIGTFVHEEIRNGATAPDKKELSPALFVGYKPFQQVDFNIRAFAKRIFRMPTFNDLYYAQIGSSALKPEYMNQYDIGFTYGKTFEHGLFNRFALQADAYYTRTKDKIIAMPTGNLFRWMMDNIGKVSGKGIEMSANAGMSIDKAYLTVNLTYAYSQSRDYTKIFGLGLSSYGDQIPYTPWHSGSALLNASYDGKLYVANSGGYRVPDYDRTVSVVDLESFKEIKKIDVAINLHRMQIDKRGDIFVTSRGDYYNTPSNLFVIDTRTDQVADTLGIGASELCMSGDSLYYYSVEWSYLTNSNNITYGIVDTRTRKVVNDRIITDGTDRQIMIPYGMQVNPETKEIYVTDAQNYVVTGYIYCFSPEGKLKWKTTAGNIPGHFAFIYE